MKCAGYQWYVVSLIRASLVMLGLNLAKGAEAGGKTMPAELLLLGKAPLVVGHRGYPVLAPENTIPSFRFALTSGADLVELDYHLSKDGVPVVIHDGELDRTTDATAKWGGKKIRVDSRTAAELSVLDAGKWFDPMYSGVRLPLLTEALDLIQGNGGITLVEAKSSNAAVLVRILRNRNLINSVVVQSFSWTYLREFHSMEPTQVLGALGPPGRRGGRKLEESEKVLGPAWIAEAEAAGARVIAWDKQVTRESVNLAHQRGLRVWVYTVNDPAEVMKLLEVGVDGIITDNPALVWKAISRRDEAATQRSARDSSVGWGNTARSRRADRGNFATTATRVGIGD